MTANNFYNAKHTLIENYCCTKGLDIYFETKSRNQHSIQSSTICRRAKCIWKSVMINLKKIDAKCKCSTHCKDFLYEFNDIKSQKKSSPTSALYSSLVDRVTHSTFHIAWLRLLKKH